MKFIISIKCRYGGFEKVGFIFADSHLEVMEKLDLISAGDEILFHVGNGKYVIVRIEDAAPLELVSQSSFRAVIAKVADPGYYIHHH